MASVVFSRLNRIKDQEINMYLGLLPLFMQKEIKRYKFLKDQKSRLLARLMLLSVLKSHGQENLISQWKRDGNNKPLIEEWKPFSISHSGDSVVFCYDTNVIGIDIEEKLRVNFEELTAYFSPEEQEFILNSSEHSLERFYEVWVKKEAVLKGMGIGIVNGLNKFSCMGNKLNYDNCNWYFHLLKFSEDYAGCIATQNSCYDISLELFNPASLLS